MLLLPHLLHLGRSIPNPRFVQLCQCIVDVIVQSDLLASSTPPPAPSAAPLGNSLLLPSIVQWLEKFIDEEDPDETKTTQAMAVPLMVRTKIDLNSQYIGPYCKACTHYW